MQATLKLLLWLSAAVALLMAGFVFRGWPGFMLALGAVVFFVLLHLSRVLRVLRAAASSPKGFVSSAVMLNSRLQAGMTLLQVVQHTRALGEPQGPLGQAEEVYRWQDPGGAWLDGRFRAGRLASWQLSRPSDAAGHTTP